MNSPYQEIKSNPDKPKSWNLWRWYEKHEKSPLNQTIISEFLNQAMYIMCMYLAEKEADKFISSIDLSQYLSNYHEIIEDILQGLEVCNENKGLKIYIGKSLNNDIHSIKVQTYDYVFSILGSQAPIKGVVYLQDYIENYEKNADI